MDGTLYDITTAPAERLGLARLRRRVVRNARGRVLEVGAGTGANLAHYPTDGAVESLHLAEPDPGMRRRLERRVARHVGPAAVTVSSAPAEGPFPEPPYDTVVATLVLCTVADPERALAAVAAALAPGGRLLYLEHVATPGAGRRLQRAVDPLWTRLAGGCHLTRRTGAALGDAGLVVTDQEVIRMPPPLFLAYAGAAIRRVRP